ncbi:MAG: DUF6893 family small protein [Solirubrobacteraceae bacterium]
MKVVLALVALLFGALFVYELPSLRRYLKIERM